MNTNEQKLDTKLAAKLRALMNLKDGAKTEAEAANAADKIARLLEKHNIDLGVLENVDEQKGTESSPDNHEWTSSIRPQDAALAGAACSMTDTQYFFRSRWVGKGKQVSVVFVGLAANVEAAKIMFNYFQQSLAAMLEARWYEGTIRGQAQIRSYRIGASTKIWTMCTNIKKERMAHAQRMRSQGMLEGQQCTDLVFIGNQVAERYMKEVVKPTGKANVNFDPSSAMAYRIGQNDGAKIDPHAKNNRMIRGAH